MTTDNIDQNSPPVLPEPVPTNVLANPPAKDYSLVQSVTDVPTDFASSGAEDGSVDEQDQLEAEWIARVDGVLQSSISDPRDLAKQISAMKAEYIFKRYGKTLKNRSGE
jgi:hypothetical protein